MKRNGFKSLVTAVTIVMAAGLLGGCASTNTTDNQPATQSKEISGSITAAGSTALQPLTEASSKTFTEKNPDASVSVQGGGSGSGLKFVSEGTADIGNSDVTAESKLMQIKPRNWSIIKYA